MPLPDERPRQSVANLIGRFEQQHKRQPSSAAPSIPRSSNVSPQIAGDPVKEETKEKKEWPPKLVAPTSADKTALTPSSFSRAAQSNSPPMPSQLTTEKLSEPAAAIISAPPEPVKPPAAQKQAIPSSGSRINPSSPAKPRLSTASASNKSPAKSQPKSSYVSQPLKPQHTGQSVASNASTIRSPSKSTLKSVPKSTPSTPFRPKTPAVHPTSVSRPKTPSGLFAPTAASLARSRNAPPPAPLPVKKATLSSSAAERLSKPTAASMSKARTPAYHAASPIRAVKSSAGSDQRGPSKLRVGLAPARMKEAKAQQHAHAADDATHEPDQLENGHAENGHDPEEVVVSDGATDLHNEIHYHGDEVPAVEEVVESAVESESVVGFSPEPVAPHIEVPANAGVVDDVPPVAEPEVHVALVEESPANGDIFPNGSPKSQEVAHTPEEVVHATEEIVHATEEVVHGTEEVTHGTEEIVHDAVSEPPSVVNDIEDMVIMLESVPITVSRPQSIVSIISIPDEHGEIPDEEQS